MPPTAEDCCKGLSSSQWLTAEFFPWCVLLRCIAADGGRLLQESIELTVANSRIFFMVNLTAIHSIQEKKTAARVFRTHSGTQKKFFHGVSDRDS